VICITKEKQFYLSWKIMMNWGWPRYLEKSRDLKQLKNSDEVVQALGQQLGVLNYPPQTLSLSSWIYEQCLCHLMLPTTGHLETELYCWFQPYPPLFLPTWKKKSIIEHKKRETDKDQTKCLLKICSTFKSIVDKPEMLRCKSFLSEKCKNIKTC